MNFYRHSLIALTATLGLGLSQGALAATSYSITNSATVTYSDELGLASDNATAEITVGVNATFPPTLDGTIDADVAANLPADAAVLEPATQSDSYSHTDLSISSYGNSQTTLEVGYSQTVTGSVNGHTVSFERVMYAGEDNIDLTGSPTLTLGGTVTNGFVNAGQTTITLYDASDFAVGDSIIVGGAGGTETFITAVSGNEITVNDPIASLPAGADDFGTIVTETADISFVVSQVGSVIAADSATVSYSLSFLQRDGDSNELSNASTSFDITIPGTNISIEKGVKLNLVDSYDFTDASSVVAEPGLPLYYQIVISNSGSADATDVSVTDTLPIDFVTFDIADVTVGPDAGNDGVMDSISHTGAASGNFDTPPSLVIDGDAGGFTVPAGESLIIEYSVTVN
jgi:uncharacterized repeat protein (TIGR01451 family)